MKNEEIKEAIEAAIGLLKAEKPLLDFAGVHERSIAHRLAVCMEKLFENWNIDCEYDRDGQDLKRLQGITECDEQKKSDRILPDIIVHHRGQPGRKNNLLVIELKKNTDKDACDRRKLELFTRMNEHDRYQYQLGLYINIKGDEFKCTWYKDGNEEKTK